MWHGDALRGFEVSLYDHSGAYGLSLVREVMLTEVPMTCKGTSGMISDTLVGHVPQQNGNEVSENPRESWKVDWAPPPIETPIVCRRKP